MGTHGASAAPFQPGGIGGMVRMEPDWPFFRYFAWNFLEFIQAQMHKQI